jgi:sulfite reductase alpha subunit-like flavoprotein
VGAGTGIAPLRSLILEREAIFKKESKCSVDIADQTPDNLLIFGCRKQSADFYYGDTWKTLVTEKRLGLWTAFSRDQWHKIYVQQVLRGADNGKLVEKHILEHGGAIYVAGGAKMARAVKEEVLECLANVVGEKQAAILLKRLNQQGRYNVEAWS